MDLEALRTLADEVGVGYARLSEEGLRKKLSFEAAPIQR